MMFGWYEMDLALGRVRDIPPLQGVGFYVAVFPGRCPGLSHWAPLGQKTGALLGPKIGAPLKGIPVRRWGGIPVRRWGGRPVGRGNLFSTPTGFKAKAQGNALG